MPCCAAYDSTVEASARVKISPDVSFCPIIGVLPSMAYAADVEMPNAVATWPAAASSAWSLADARDPY
jgi:hypothetical protein